MGQIIGRTAKPDACNLRSLSSFGIPAAGQHILVSTDNSAMENGQGNFDAYVVGDGTKAATALPLQYIDPLKGMIEGETSVEMPYDSANELYCENEGFITKSGGLISSSNWFYTNFIDISNATQIRAKAVFNNEYGGGVAFYDSSYTFISSLYMLGSGSNQTNSEVTIEKSDFPSGACYAKVTCWKHTMVGKGDYFVEITNHVQGIFIDRLDNIDKDIAEINEHTQEDIDVTNYGLLVDIYADKAYDSSGKLVTSSGRNATSLVVLDWDNDMYFSTTDETNVIFFDEDKNFLSTLQGTFSGEWTASSSRGDILRTSYPSGAKYVAFDFNPSNLKANAFYVSTTPNFIAANRYSTIIKRKGTRPKVYIYTADTEVEIFEKLLNAWLTRDCDVIWECGEYSFSAIYSSLSNYDGYTGAGAYEIIVGGNCHYYFNNSVITGSLGDANTANLFGVRRTYNASFKMFDGTLIANDMVYVVHDEGQGKYPSYIHEYHNMIMQYVSGDNTTSLSKCIGGGTGIHSEVVIDGCIFKSDNSACSSDVSWHGHTSANASVESEFKLFVKNCYFSKGLDLQTLATNETATLLYVGNIQTISPSETTGWTIYSQSN